MKKRILTLCLAVSMSLSLPLISHADTPTFSEYWYQDQSSTWHIKDGNGNIVKNAWLCDDAVSTNGQNIWYLLDANGEMVSKGLVQDQTGNIYSLETSHNGYYGMLRYQSGVYDGIYLDLESSHSGSFANIKNADGRASLEGMYGLTQVNIDNSNIVYTSNFRNTGYTSSGSSTGSSSSDSSSSSKGGNPVVDNDAQSEKDRQMLRDMGLTDDQIAEMLDNTAWKSNYGGFK